MFRVILVCLVIRIRDMLNYLKIIHFHRGKKYTYKFMVCRSLSSTLLPPAAINSSEISTTEYWTWFFFSPIPSIFTTLCQITSCNLQQCSDIFSVDGMHGAGDYFCLQFIWCSPQEVFQYLANWMFFKHFVMFKACENCWLLLQADDDEEGGHIPSALQCLQLQGVVVAGVMLSARSCVSLQDSGMWCHQTHLARSSSVGL